MPELDPESTAILEQVMGLYVLRRHHHAACRSCRSLDGPCDAALAIDRQLERLLRVFLQVPPAPDEA